MKKSRKNILTGLFMTAACFAVAAPPPPIGGSMNPACWPPPCLPIDGGVTFIIAAAALYGGKKLYDFQKKTS